MDCFASLAMTWKRHRARLIRPHAHRCRLRRQRLAELALLGARDRAAVGRDFAGGKLPGFDLHTGAPDHFFDGKGLGFVIERALDADIPIVIAVSRQSFADWIKFAGGMSVKLACDRHALDAWWRNVSLRTTARIAPDHTTVCEAFK